MKWVLAAIIFVGLVGTATAQGGRLRYAASTASDACVASCSSASEQCKRTCSAILNTPCLASCDSQYQACTSGCRNK